MTPYSSYPGKFTNNRTKGEQHKITQNRDYVQDVLVENCSNIFDTSAIHGGRIPVLQDDSREGGGSERQEHVLEQNPVTPLS